MEVCCPFERRLQFGNRADDLFARLCRSFCCGAHIALFSKNMIYLLQRLVAVW